MTDEGFRFYSSLLKRMATVSEVRTLVNSMNQKNETIQQAVEHLIKKN